MKTECLIGSRVIWDCNNSKIKLEYYLTASKWNPEEKETLYGIKIVKYQFENREVEALKGISYSKKFVEQMISCLMDHTVTPICMLEVVDDYITKELMFA